MPTTKKRINISLSPEAERALTEAARRASVPEATKAAALLEVALQIEEDVALDAAASERYRTNSRWLSHDEVWG